MNIPKCDFCGDTKEVFDEESGLRKVCLACSCGKGKNNALNVAPCPAGATKGESTALRFFQQVADACCASGHEQW